jgi:hypothetical protein
VAANNLAKPLLHRYSVRPLGRSVQLEAVESQELFSFLDAMDAVDAVLRMAYFGHDPGRRENISSGFSLKLELPCSFLVCADSNPKIRASKNNFPAGFT